MSTNLPIWIGFNAFILLMLAIDLGVFHRKSHEVSLKESLILSVAWISLALLFNIGIYFLSGREPALAFFTGYLIEKALSMDNLFVFLLIFSYFKVPAVYQHKVLFWGIFGALIMRAIFIAAGIALIKHFHWIIYVFGGLLVYSGIKLMFEKTKEVHPEQNPVVKLFRYFFPVTKDYVGGKFFTRENSTIPLVKKTSVKVFATPLFIVLLVVETTDLIFAVDSIPAILAITQDPFIVYTSNVFAILGLRALYFTLSSIMGLFHLLNYGLSLILIFVGVKMLLESILEIPIGLSLGIVAGVLTCSIIASIIFPAREKCKLPTA